MHKRPLEARGEHAGVGQGKPPPKEPRESGQLERVEGIDSQSVVLLRDAADVEPKWRKRGLDGEKGRMGGATGQKGVSTNLKAEVLHPPGPQGEENPYAAFVLPPSFVACETDLWDPQAEEAEQPCSVVEISDVERRKRARKAASRWLTQRINAALDHPFALFIFMIFTFWALFMEDIRVAADMDVLYDKPFGCISFSIMTFFLLEWAFKTWAEQGYALSFFFFIDFAASLSMIIDSLNCFATNGRCALLPSAGGLSGVLQSLQQTARLARILRLLRVLRIVKIVALLRARSRRVKNSSAETSRLGKELEDKIVRSVVSTVIILVLVVPFLEYSETDYGDVHGLQMLALARATASFPAMLADYEARTEYYSQRYSYEMSLLTVKLFDPARYESEQTPSSVPELLKSDTDEDFTLVSEVEYPLCFEQVLDATKGCPAQMERQIRCSYIKTATLGVCRADAVSGRLDWTLCRGLSVFSIKRQRMAEAAVGITTQLFIAALLIASFQLFSADVRALVVRPIESMVDMVRKLASNPKMQLESKGTSRFETKAVRIALAKIVGLMQLGFGGAGHEIIAANLADAEGQELDLLQKGRKLDCAYGFCDIRQFTDTVECLQDQVMLFTNSVGEYVHHACNDNRGEPNKNIGDAFLIVWRQPPETKSNLPIGERSKVCDGALTAFRRCVREIASSQTLKLVTDVPAIHKKFGKDQYKTKIGFGLHHGWSVEGPVGTAAKIDCSYLSPEVKISDRLEAATKIYCCNILMTGQFYDLLSEHLKVGLRLVDHITLKGGTRPFRIYTCDRSNLWLKISTHMLNIYGAAGAYNQFSQVFHEGINAFIKGDWRLASERIEAALDFCPEDMPSILLLGEMKKRSIDPRTPTAPKDWKGYHESEV